MHISEFEDYRKYLKQMIGKFPRNGWGQMQKIATNLGVGTSVLSQIIGGTRNLSQEHTCKLSEYMGLNEKETDYFLTLVELDRAGSEKLKRILRLRLADLKSQFKKIVHRIPKSHTLSEEDRIQFYSLWYYSAIRILTSLEKYDSVEKLSASLGLAKTEVRRVVDFLLATGLCTVKEDGALTFGAQRTHIPEDSPFAARHHCNWRQKTMEWSTALVEGDLMYTSLVSISMDDFQRIREKITKLIAEINPIVDSSKEETAVVFAIDWVRFKTGMV